jgi:uncharacterized protein DUF4157
MKAVQLARQRGPVRAARQTLSRSYGGIAREGHTENERGLGETDAGDSVGTGPRWSFAQAATRPTQRDSNGERSSAIDRALKTPGEPLETSCKKHFENRFGHDLSQVRIHTGDQASEAATSLHASAFTLGIDIVFARGRYSPGTPSGRLLLLHELGHVEQQRSASPTDRPLIDSPASPNSASSALPRGKRSSSSTAPS